MGKENQLINSLEVQCSECKERFKDEEDLMRHMDHIHQRSMYDRIKYKRAKTDESSDNTRHPKNKKGKGKGKKSIETKPVRKESALWKEDKTKPKDQEEQQVIEETTREADDNFSIVEDSSPMEIELDENFPTSGQFIQSKENTKESENELNDISRSSSKSMHSVENVEENEIEISQAIKKEDSNQRGKKREKSKQIVDEDEPSSKRTRGDVSRIDSAVAGAEGRDEWQDIECVYCNQQLPVSRQRPGQNRRKYQAHLLTHMLDTQYSGSKHNH